MPRPAFWRGLSGEGTSIRPGRQNSGPWRGSGVCSLAQQISRQLRVSFMGGSITKVLTAQRQQLPLRLVKQEDILETCCHLRSAGLSATSPLPDLAPGPRSAG